MLNRLVRSFVPALVLASLPVASFAAIAVGVSIDIAPPPLPVYVQPVAPGPDYIWTPGYWAWSYDDEDYYWVPGTWILAPSPGLLWTPGYWGWLDGVYIWHAGYWGPHVGFYGGVNYGFGYTGVGFDGCFWRGGHVVYNRAVTNVTNINVTNVYNRTVVANNYSHVSFNGGRGGILAHASRAQLAAEHERHFEPTSMQRQHFDMAAHNRDLRASVNQGRPHIAATERPASFSGRGVVGARAAGGDIHPAAFRNDRPQQGQRESMQRHDQPQRMDRPPQQARMAQPRPEMHGGSARPDMHTMPARPDMRAQAAPRPEMRAQASPRPEMHAQAGPRPEMRAAPPRPEMHSPAPRPEMHAAPPRPEMRSAPPRPEMRSAPPRPEMRGGGASEPRMAGAERPQGPQGGGGQPHGGQAPPGGGREGGHDRR